MAIVQSKSSDMTLLIDKLQEEPDISILDYIPDDSLIIRIGGVTKSSKNFYKSLNLMKLDG